MSDLLELCNFSIHRNDITLFEPLSLIIEAGQAYELRGQNGVGIASPVLGLRPVLAGRSFTVKLPKPMRLTSFPALRAFVI
jgi:ABC-type transport system involved in cytochrome c biogenesis ATPase subunit